MTNECKMMREEIQSHIESIQQRVMEKQALDAGVETRMVYDINEVWSDYRFILQGVLYRWDNCFSKLRKILNCLPPELLQEEKSWFMPFGMLGDELSYEFENLVVSFPKLYEEALIVEMKRHIPTEEKTLLEKIRPKKNDEKGLYWELNLLRNRAAHSTPGFYTEHESRAARYLSMSSRIRGVDYKNGIIKLPTFLFSLRNTAHTQEVIKKQIIDKKSAESLLELLFEGTKPKGRGKNSPQMLYIENVQYFDMNEEFLQLSMDMFKFIETQIGIFDRCI